MGRSNRFANMNEVYMRIETACKEQSTIRLQHVSGGLNSCRRQPIPQFAEAESKFITETRQYKGDQFWALEDQLETSPTQISNLCRYKGNGSRNSSVEHRTYGR